ncbi:uncharacterized protein LOC142224625 [Haematobia irritans]|uniref:uncharacterized protein LOC142224625 n=1 Tax=Haematobia irritans TaxID=7368 RepID=UPI003F5052EC
MPSGEDSRPQENQEDDTMVQRVSVKVPPFWPERPEIWFAQIEAQFGIGKIVTDRSKFNTVVAAVESNVLAQISDAILNPPETGKYDNLKKCIIERFCESEQKKTQKLLSDVELGDRRPTQLLSELKELAKDKVSDDFLKSLWLQRLPANVRAILQASNAELGDLAKLADKVMEVSDFEQVCAIEKPSQESTMSEICRRMSRLERNFDRMFKKQIRSRSSSSRSCRNQSNSSVPASGECWYHRRFGPKSEKCRAPCSFTTTQKN